MKLYIAFVLAGLTMNLATSPAWADEKSHRAAAEELLKVSNTETVMKAAIDTTLDAQIKASPELEQFKDIMRQFLGKHLSYAALKNELITLYAAEFTEGELKELTAFYRTPTGKKAVEKLPQLMQKSSELGMKRVQENLPELQRMIEAKVKGQQVN